MANSDREPFRCLPVAGESFWAPGQPDSRRTALREAAYIRRTKFEQRDLVHDFACRAEDLFMLTAIVPVAAPEWTRRPFLRWKLADEAAERADNGHQIRAWHVCADLPPHMSRGQWMDEAEAIVRDVLPETAVAEMVGHLPVDKPPHIHILVAARSPAARCYGHPLPTLEEVLQHELKARWLDWINGGRDGHSRRLRLAA